MKHSERVGSGCYTKPTPPNCGFFKPVELTDDFDTNPIPRLCFFYEDHGQDQNKSYGVTRWRVSFYYASHFAITKFWTSEEGKNRFLATLEKET